MINLNFFKTLLLSGAVIVLTSALMALIISPIWNASVVGLLNVNKLGIVDAGRILFMIQLVSFVSLKRIETRYVPVVSKENEDSADE